MTKNLFDTRGGVAMIDRCEECNDPIAPDSVTGLCRACLSEQEGEEE